MNQFTRATSLVAIVIFAASTAFGATILVDPSQEFVSTGILASAGESFSITAVGVVDLAPNDGNYSIDPDGVIVGAPVFGSPSYSFFLTALTNGVAPDVGAKKFVGGFAYGALLAGFSTLANPTLTTDFPLGFTLVGSSGTATAPAGGGYLFLRVNDINRGNAGAYIAEITNGTNSGTFDINGVPEPGTFLLMSPALLVGFGLRMRRSRATA